MTGRAAGWCAGYGMPGFANPMRGRGFGRGLGMGLGFRGGRGRFGGVGGWGGRWWRGAAAPASAAPYAAGPTREQETELLKAQAASFESALQDIRQRIGELESSAQDA